jgi:hypothetical protein
VVGDDITKRSSRKKTTDWRYGSSGRAPAWKCETLNSNPSPTKRKKRQTDRKKTTIKRNQLIEIIKVRQRGSDVRQ